MQHVVISERLDRQCHLSLKGKSWTVNTKQFCILENNELIMLSESKQTGITGAILSHHRYYYTTSKIPSYILSERKIWNNKNHTTHMHLLASGTGVPSCQVPYKERVLALNGLHILTLDNWKYRVLNWILSQSAKYEASRSVPHKGSTPSHPHLIFSMPQAISSHFSTCSPNMLVYKDERSSNHQV